MANEQKQQPTAQQQPVAQSQEIHPLATINIPQSIMPLAQAMANPLATFRQCFPTKKEADMAYLQQVEFAMQAMQANNYLISCAQKNPVALDNALKQVALSGLSLSPVSKQGYLVPFKGDISFMPSYIGLRDILIRTGLVQNIEAHLVYPDDLFEISYGNNGHLVHKPAVFSKNRKKENILGGYFITTLSTGSIIYDTMSIDEIDKVHKRSPSFGKQSPWDSDFEEMAKKTLIRRGFKSVPHTAASQEQMRIIEMAFENDDKFFISQSENQAKVSHDDFEDAEVLENIKNDNEEQDAPVQQSQPQ